MAVAFEAWGAGLADFVPSPLSLSLLCVSASAALLAAGHVDVVELLLHEGAQINAQNHNGDTALHLAVWKKHAMVVRVLLAEQWKANVGLLNHEGKTAEQLARTDEIREMFVKQACNTQTIHMAPPEEDDDGPDQTHTPAADASLPARACTQRVAQTLSVDCSAPQMTMTKEALSTR